jgi:hypothetical protein
MGQQGTHRARLKHPVRGSHAFDWVDVIQEGTK